MWDFEADVVIVGFGGAGATAALTAHDLGAKVLMLEKNSAGGGNTRYSGGSMRTYLDHGKAADYFESLCEGTTERSVVEAYVAESSRNPEWVVQIGGEVVSKPPAKGFPKKISGAAFAAIKGAEGIGPRVRVKGAGAAAGIDLWGILSRNVEKRNIQVIYSSPAKRLLFEKESGVSGVIAASGEKDIKVRAKRAVILTCGGFEYDQAMHLNYLGHRYAALCNPGNTGDGIRLAADIGADLWHMGASALTLGFKFPEFEFGIRQLMPAAGYIYVDQMGKRFMDEPGTDSHIMWATTSNVDTRTLQRRRMPAYVIFDEDTRMRGPVAVTGGGKISDVYQWSVDNSAEVRKGWIKAADNIGHLATQISIRSEVLQSAVAQYNLQCVGGYDADHGRAPETLVPLGRPPYYAMEIWPCLFNTHGGPKRNAQAQVLDVWGHPIKRLYSAGELGSLWNRNYPGAGNVSEALAFGRIAGRNAAAERPAPA